VHAAGSRTLETNVASVIIVDDQSTSRIILEELLVSIDPGLAFAHFANPMAALAWVDRNTPDLILTDYRMPELNGVEFVRRLRQLPNCADVPIMVITVVDDRVVRYEALDAGATDVLVKPIDHHECRARCSNLLALRRQSQMLRTRTRWLEKQVREFTATWRARERESLLLLARCAEQREDPSGVRVTRVGRFAHLIAAHLGLDVELCETIEYAAMLHDVGKLLIPEQLLLKCGRLSGAEFDTVRTHCALGHDLLQSRDSPVLQTAAEVALAHHEHLDGRGYPGGRRGEEIPLAARITAVADVYDAVTSPRPYGPAASMARAIETLREGKGTRFDPDCVEAFCAQLDQVAAFDQPRAESRDAH
jgi:two-component system response regulator RpfG